MEESTTCCFKFLTTILCLVTVITLYLYHKFSYWELKKIPHIKERTLTPTSEELKQIYKDFRRKRAKQFGFFSIFGHPQLVLLDLELIKRVMSTDFQHFSSRGLYVNEVDDPLTGNLFNLSGERWKKLRTKLTPTFTSGKMKMMVPTVVKCAKIMESNLLKMLDQKGRCADVKKLFSAYTTDVIGIVAFGIDCNGFDEHSEFTRYGNEVFRASNYLRLKRLFCIMFPQLAKFFHVSFRDARVAKFFTKLVRDIIDDRKRNNYKRDDFMQLLIDLNNDQETENSMTLNEITAQAFLFFAAGFETSSSTMTFCLYELAVHQALQNKAREEINKVLAKHDGALTHESLSDMKYLSQVIDETLRKYPPGAMFVRKCVRNYKVPDTDFVIEDGVRIIIPTYRIHHDPEYHENPHMFDPDRFSSENKDKMRACSYMPFGEGPRICIASRFGLMETKIGLALLLSKYRFTLNERTPKNLGFVPTALALSFDGDVYVNVDKTNDSQLRK